MEFWYKDFLLEIIDVYVAGINKISYAVSEPYKFNEYLDYLQYVAINRVLIYLIQNPEKGIIWWSKNPIEELPTCSSVLVVGNKTGIPVLEMTLGHNLT